MTIYKNGRRWGRRKNLLFKIRDGTKVCSTCGKRRWLRCFYKDSHNKSNDGMRYQCVICYKSKYPYKGKIKYGLEWGK